MRTSRRLAARLIVLAALVAVPLTPSAASASRPAAEADATAVAAVTAAPAEAEAVTARVRARALIVSGTSGPDVIAVGRTRAGRIGVDVGADGSPEFAFPRATFETVDVRGGAGDDRLSINERFGAFTDDKRTRLLGGDGDDRLVGGIARERLNSGAGDDWVDGHRGRDLVTLGRGDDRFTWTEGDRGDIVNAGAGYDTVVAHGSPGRDRIQIWAAASDRVGIYVNLDVGAVEQVDVEGGRGADWLYVDRWVARWVRFTLVGGPGADTIDGGPLRARVYGGGGDDVLDGRGGRDVVFGGPGSDTITDGDGQVDHLYGGSDLSREGCGSTSDVDTITVDSRAPGVVYGGNLNSGSNCADGSDVIDIASAAGAGVDRVFGGNDNRRGSVAADLGDTITVGASDAIVHGGNRNAGASTGADADDGMVVASAGSGRVFGGNLNLSGSRGDDGSDVIVTGPGADAVHGGNANVGAGSRGTDITDYIDPGPGADRVWGGNLNAHGHGADSGDEITVVDFAPDDIVFGDNEGPGGGGDDRISNDPGDRVAEGDDI